MAEMATREAPYAEAEGFETEDIIAFISGKKTPPKQVLFQKRYSAALLSLLNATV
jgi:hypothetical protein